MTMKPALIAMSVAQVLAACTTLSGPLVQLHATAPTPPTSSAEAAAPISHESLIGPGTAIALPKPRDFGRSIEVAQLVTLQFGGQSLAFDVRLSITPDRLVLVAIDGMGRRAITVEWNGDAMTVQTAPWLPSAVRPASMLSDVVVLFFPIAAVRQALAAANCELAITKRTRVVHCGEAEVIRVEYDEQARTPWDGKLHYANLAWGYEADVRSAEVKP
jgi:Protein of unknown function (DUF3261)